MNNYVVVAIWEGGTKIVFMASAENVYRVQLASRQYIKSQGWENPCRVRVYTFPDKQRIKHVLTMRL